MKRQTPIPLQFVQMRLAVDLLCRGDEVTERWPSRVRIQLVDPDTEFSARVGDQLHAFNQDVRFGAIVVDRELHCLYLFDVPEPSLIKEPVICDFYSIAILPHLSAPAIHERLMFGG